LLAGFIDNKRDNNSEHAYNHKKKRVLNVRRGLRVPSFSFFLPFHVIVQHSFFHGLAIVRIDTYYYRVLGLQELDKRGQLGSSIQVICIESSIAIRQN
jgi:hypothetical protein